MPVIRPVICLPPIYLPLSHFMPVKWSDRDVPVVMRSQPGPKYRLRTRAAQIG